MDKRTFLKTSGTLLTGSLLPKLFADEMQTGLRKNWSGNFEYHAQRLHLPKSLKEVQQDVLNCKQIKALGSHHSFNSVADSPTDQISLQHFDHMELDAQAHTVTVGAGVTYSQLAPFLQSKGFALHNLASLPGITVAGAVSTGTHGSGVKNKNLSSSVIALEMVTGDGNVVSLSREKDADLFTGVVVGMGSLGITTKLTLQVQPTYNVAQMVYTDLSFDQLQHNIDEIFSSGYSVSIFTDWQNHKATEVWIKRRLEKPADANFPNQFFGASRATENLHPLLGQSAETCTPQMGVPGPWYERLPHFRIGATPSNGTEIQTEYMVPAEHAYHAVLAVESLKDHITPHLFVTELRRIEADDLWMSMFYQRSSLAIHFTWKREWPQVKEVLPMIEEKLAPFQPRPHWAKEFTLAPSRIQAAYAKLPAFKDLIKRYDPNAKFRNDFIQRNLYS